MCGGPFCVTGSFVVGSGERPLERKCTCQSRKTSMKSSPKCGWTTYRARLLQPASPSASHTSTSYASIWDWRSEGYSHTEPQHTPTVCVNVTSVQRPTQRGNTSQRGRGTPTGPRTRWTPAMELRRSISTTDAGVLRAVPQGQQTTRQSHSGARSANSPYPNRLLPLRLRRDEVCLVRPVPRPCGSLRPAPELTVVR